MNVPFGVKLRLALYTLNTRSGGEWLQTASDDMVWLTLDAMLRVG